MKPKILIIGAGGNAKVIADIIIKNNDELLGFLDDKIEIGTNVIAKYNILGKVKDCLKYKKDTDVKFIISIGDNAIREKISKKYLLNYYTAIHPNAIIGMETEIQEGTVIMANASISPNTKIGKHCIINTGSIIEHDSEIGNFVHISPNVALGGTVKIGKGSHIGIGATVKNNISISSNVKIGAGAVVVKDISQEGTYIGVPARVIERGKI